jgi:hypothetical protein
MTLLSTLNWFVALLVSYTLRNTNLAIHLISLSFLSSCSESIVSFFNSPFLVFVLLFPYAPPYFLPS